MDAFLTKKTCDRCDKELKSRIMSMFNVDALCLECHTLETHMEGFEEALLAEHEAMQRGDYNFPGVGLPSKTKE